MYSIFFKRIFKCIVQIFLIFLLYLKIIKICIGISLRRVWELNWRLWGSLSIVRIRIVDNWIMIVLTNFLLKLCERGLRINLSSDWRVMSWKLREIWKIVFKISFINSSLIIFFFRIMMMGKMLITLAELLMNVRANFLFN